METPFFRELKKQTSFFLKEKIRVARLALTDVTAIELLAEELTDGNNQWAREARKMSDVSKAAFEVDEYRRIVEVLRKRLLSRSDNKRWRESYYALVLLEHLLMHGPQSFSEEFQSDRDVIEQVGRLHHVDNRGFDWGLAARKKSERILVLLENGSLLKQERDQARALTRKISRNLSLVPESNALNNEEQDCDLGKCSQNVEENKMDFGQKTLDENTNGKSIVVERNAEENKIDFGQKILEENTNGKSRGSLHIEPEKLDHPFNFYGQYTRISLISEQA